MTIETKDAAEARLSEIADEMCKLEAEAMSLCEECIQCQQPNRCLWYGRYNNAS